MREELDGLVMATPIEVPYKAHEAVGARTGAVVRRGNRRLVKTAPKHQSLCFQYTISGRKLSQETL